MSIRRKPDDGAMRSANAALRADKGTANAAVKQLQAKARAWTVFVLYKDV
jgi:hypothetical protein